MAYYADFDALHGVEAGKHLYQFYKSREDYLRIMVAFFRSGLEKGDACLWLVPEHMGRHEAEDYASRLIRRFSFYVKTGQMTLLSADRWYLKDGVFDEAQALANAENYYKKINEAGFTRFRGAGAASAIPRNQWSLLPSYEKKIGELAKQLPIICLCAYPILECSISETRSVLETHDGVLVGKV